MPVARFGIFLFCCFVVMMGALPLPGAVQAREAGTCTALAQNALSSVAQSCAGAAANSVCLGYDAVTATFAASAQPTFKAKGDKVNLADVTSLTTSVANPEAGNWGVAVLKIQANVPEASQGITGVIFGDATLTSAVKADDLLTLPVTTVRDVALLRGGAAQTYPSLIKLMPGQKATVDGRNKAGDWLRVRLIPPLVGPQQISLTSMATPKRWPSSKIRICAPDSFIQSSHAGVYPFDEGGRHMW